MEFLTGNHKDWQKSRDFWFANFLMRFLNSMGWYGFFYGFLVVLNLLQQCFVLS